MLSTYRTKILFGSVLPTLLGDSINGKGDDIVDDSHHFEESQYQIDNSHCFKVELQ